GTPGPVAGDDLLVVLRALRKKIELARAESEDPALVILVRRIRIQSGRVRIEHEAAVQDREIPQLIVLGGVLVKEHVPVEPAVVLEEHLAVREAASIGKQGESGGGGVSKGGGVDDNRVGD